MPLASWTIVNLNSDSVSSWALDVQTPARLVVAGAVGSGAHDESKIAAQNTNPGPLQKCLEMVLLLLNSSLLN
jgi:hypothetical protein